MTDTTLRACPGLGGARGEGDTRGDRTLRDTELTLQSCAGPTGPSSCEGLLVPGRQLMSPGPMLEPGPAALAAGEVNRKWHSRTFLGESVNWGS